MSFGNAILAWLAPAGPRGVGGGGGVRKREEGPRPHDPSLGV